MDIDAGANSNFDGIDSNEPKLPKRKAAAAGTAKAKKALAEAPAKKATAFNIMQRRQVLWQLSTKVKRSNFQQTAEMFAGISPEDIKSVTNRFAGGDHTTAYSDSEWRVLRFMKEVKLVNGHVPGSNAARLAMRNEIWALMLSHGLPSFFITINPADVYNPLVKFLAGKEIDLDNLLPTDVPKYWDQTLLVANNPVVAAKFFNIYIQAFIKSILGYDPDCKSVKFELAPASTSMSMESSELDWMAFAFPCNKRICF